MSTTGQEDDDKLFLDEVLNSLYDFGDGPASKKNLKSQRKKKRKSCEEDHDEEQEEVNAVKDVNRETNDSGEEHLDLGHHREKTRKGSNVEHTGQPIPQTPQVEVVIFRDPTKRAKRYSGILPRGAGAPDINTVPQKTVQKSDKTEQLSLEKARLEVHRFGITGYRKEQQRVFEQDRAIMLGARPPKKEYVNYKVLQQQVKEKKQKSKEEAQLNLKKNKKKQSKPRDKKKSASSGSGSGPSGQVGRFKNGVLVLSHQDIQNIKGIKGRK